MLVNAKEEGALEAQLFAGLAGGELLVNALDGGRSEMERSCESRGTNPVVMPTIKVLTKRLGAMAAWPHPGQRRDKGEEAIQTAKPPGVNEQPRGLSQAAQVPGLA